MPADDGPSALPHNSSGKLTAQDMAEHAESMYRLHQGEQTPSSLYNWLGAEYEFLEFIEAALPEYLGIDLPPDCEGGETLMVKLPHMLAHMAANLMAARHEFFSPQESATVRPHPLLDAPPASSRIQ